jgi:antitoxin (DNA-binding transcriptional repressor) of toxin-antitoxin stability system
MKPAEQARAKLPSILSSALNGESTVISRRGQAIAAVVPMSEFRKTKVASLMTLAGTGKGLWGKSSGKSIQALRDEWSR